MYAAADGVVTRVAFTKKGLGNVVEIDHGNGFVTRYCLLGELFTVKGRKVKRGQKIGSVGISAAVAAPHLHFEVLRHDVVQDPANYLFASLTPEEYARLLYMSVSTGQSLD